MKFIKKILTKKASYSYIDFWLWFQKNENKLYKTVKKGENIEQDFFDKLSPKLNSIREGFWYLTGMYDDATAELIITADGEIENIVFVEELITAAPNLTNWRFTALKPAMDIEKVNVKYDGYRFSKDNLFFYPNDIKNCPDEIDIDVFYSDYQEKDREAIISGIYLFLDNYLGELYFATMIDNIEIVEKKDNNKEWIPISKLKDFLIWREKEFVEKYSGKRKNTEGDTYKSLEAKGKDDNPMYAVVNSDLLNWDRKPSHPWILTVLIKYNGNEFGLPDSETLLKIEEIETYLEQRLQDIEGHLKVVRKIGNNEVEVYFACKDFRLPSKVADKLMQNLEIEFDVTYEIFKDKYWLIFRRFMVH